MSVSKSVMMKKKTMQEQCIKKGQTMSKYELTKEQIEQGFKIVEDYAVVNSYDENGILDGEDYEMYSSPDIPEAATFGVYINGDSMEPRYHNEELVWIEQTQQLDDGEIGIFYLDGDAYIKKFQNNKKGTYLISLNKKYDPIPITEDSSFKIFGRVLS